MATMLSSPKSSGRSERRILIRAPRQLARVSGVVGASVAVLAAACLVVIAWAPTAGAVPSTLGPCTGDLTGTVFTLGADCDTTASIPVPDGFTVEGAGHVITAHDPAGGGSFTGAVVTNAGTSMNVNNVIIRGTGFVTNCQVTLLGLLFNDASGTATNVTVENITQHSGCQTGNGIRANALAGTARTVTLTGVTVTGFQKNGVTGSGQVTLNVSGSTIGPPDQHQPGSIATNSVQYGVGGAGGTFTGNNVIGSAFGSGTSASTAILLFSAANVTIDNNTITGAATDFGISVNFSTGVTISHNAVGRTPPASPDAGGIGINVDAGAALVSALDPAGASQVASTATLICNTFSGWNTDIVGAVQISCTPLPPGTECQTYSASALSVEGGTPPFTWSVASGTLPPGLTLDPATGAITGTPTAAGAFDFTVMVVDSTQPSLSATQAQSITIAPDCAAPTTIPGPTTGPTVAPTAVGTLPPTGSGSSAPLYDLALAVLALGSLAIVITARRRAGRT